MTTLKGEISSGEAGHLQEQLIGKVWLAQSPGQWPITLMTSESQVITHLKNHPDSVVWVYDIRPSHRVEIEQPAPKLVPYDEG